MANVLDWKLEGNGFELQLHYYVHIQTNTLGENITFHLIPPAMGWIVPQLFLQVWIWH